MNKTQATDELALLAIDPPEGESFAALLQRGTVLVQQGADPNSTFVGWDSPMLAFVIAEGSGADGVEMLYRVGARVQEDHVRSATNLIESLKQRLEGSPGDRLADLLLDLDRLVMLEQQLDSMRLEVPEELRINGQTVLRGQGHLGVIYNNLAGLNIAPPSEYRAYLEYMRTELLLERLGNGDSMTFFANLYEVTSCRLGDKTARRVTADGESLALREQCQQLNQSLVQITARLGASQPDESTTAQLEYLRSRLDACPWVMRPEGIMPREVF